MTLAVLCLLLSGTTLVPVANASSSSAHTGQDADEALDGEAPVDETEGLLVRSSTEYTPDPVNQRIDVRSTFDLTNEQPDEVVGSSTRSYFYTTWVIALPSNVTDFAATSDGITLATQIDQSTDAIAEPEREPGEPDPNANVVFGSITLPTNLSFGESVTLDVSYTIPGGEPRAEGPVARVNDSFLSFSVWTAGDPGLTTVSIAIPEGFMMDLRGDLAGLTQVERDGQPFLEAVNIEAPRMFFGQVYGRNDRGLITEQADVPGGQATVRAWPDDPAWADFVVDTIERDLPVIEDLIGIEWPAGDIEVIETVTPYLYGYGGWFNASSGLIEIGETLERDLILHELAHAWFNADLIDGRWITEGLAEEFASQTLALAAPAVGVEPPTPEQLVPTEPDLNDPLRVPLSAWASPWTLSVEDAFAYEQFHYNASWWVVRQITDDVGLEAFSDVLIALENDELAYRGEGPVEQTQTPTRWTHLFDLLEFQAGATELDQLFATYVLTPTDAALLTDRRETLVHFQDLAQAGDDWAVPLLVRRDMSAWRFDDAQTHVDAARKVVDLRDEVKQLAVQLNVIVDSGAEVPFETASSTAELDSVLAMVQQMQVDLVDLARSRAELGEQAAAMGTSIGFDEMTLADARTDEMLQQSAVANVGDLRQQVERLARELGLAAPPWPSSDGVTDFEAQAALAQARSATLVAIDSASTVTSSPRSLVQRLGLWGTDVDEQLALARSSFEADDLDDALAATRQTELLISQASSAGQRRLIYAGIGVAVLLMSIASRAVFSRRRP